MKPILPLFSFLISFGLFAQTEFLIPHSDTLLLNKVLITKGVSIHNLVGSLGEADRVEEYKSGEKSYFYDTQSFVLFTKDEIVGGVGINFNWDEDDKFPQKSFDGSFVIGKKKINKRSQNSDFENNRSIEFICPIDGLCATKDRDAKNKILVAFNEKGVVTQISVLLN